jgi:hypothetical protein
MTNKFTTKGTLRTPVQSEQGPLASAGHVSADEGIHAIVIEIIRLGAIYMGFHSMGLQHTSET